MKFPRSARIFRGHLDVAPFAGVFLVLLIFVLLDSLIYTPGIEATIGPGRSSALAGINPPIDLPQGDNLAGTDRPTIAVAVDAAGRFYYENQPITAPDLGMNLAAAARNSSQPLTLLIMADRATTYGELMRLALLARDAGITNQFFAALPRAKPAPPAKPPKP